MKLRVAVVLAVVAAVQQGAGTASLAGSVVDAAGTGLAGVEVRISEDAGAGFFVRRTDADGRFGATGLPAGRFVVTAVADGFLPSSYGAMAHGQPGVPIRLAAGGRAGDVRITLERPASIAGRVANEEGEPVPGAVHAMAASWTGTDRSLRRMATARTGADGRYTISGLTPGSYVLLATPPAEAVPDGAVRTEEGQPRLAYQAAFYPGVTAAAYAATVTVVAGEDARGLDVLVRRAPVTTVEVDPVSDGRPLAYPAAVLVPEAVGEVGLEVDTSPSARPLRFAHVPAGRYTVIGSALEASPSGVLERLWSRAIVDVDGSTPVEMPLALGPGARLEGRLMAGDKPLSGADLPETWLWPIRADYPTGILPFGGTLVAGASGEFTISGIAPGRYVMQFGRDRSSQIAGWSVRRVMVAGQDLADLPIDLRLGDRFTDVEVVLSNRESELLGTLSDATGAPRYDVTLVAFPADSRYWWTGTRRIRLARPDTSGSYVMRGLPEGEYLLAAVAGPVPDEPTDPQWLGALSGAAVRVLVSDGGRTVQDLRVGSQDVTRPASRAGEPGPRASRPRQR